MKAERNPLPETSLLAAPLEAVTRWVLRFPGVVVAAALMLAVLSVLVTVNGLRFKTSRLDLLNPRSEYNQRWLAYLDEFGDRDDAVIVVRGDQTADIVRTIDDLDAQLRTQPELFESIFSRRDLSKLKSKALHFLPEEELAQIEQQLRIASASMPRGGQAAMPLQATRRTYNNPPAPHPSPTGQGPDVSPLAAIENGLAQFEPQYLLADEGRLGFVLLKLKLDTGEFARGSKAIGQLRRIIAQVRERHPEAWIGLTGMPVIEFDEMQASQTDMFWTSFISLAAVALLFVASYGGMRHAILANIVLLIAMAWSFGLITLVVGHLNILSSAFACVLIGIGIDYGTYYVACYLRLRGEGRDEVEALIETARDVGPGMVTGGVTTAAAFFATAMTDFVGVRELGLVAGYGILLCVIAAAVVLPALVVLVDRQWPLARVPQILPAGGVLNWPLARPRLVILATLATTIVAGAGLAYVRYDHNLLNLQPKHLESADIERQILTQLEDSVWYAVSICDSPADLEQRKARFAALPTVAKTEDIASLLPPLTAGKAARIAAIHEHLAALPDPQSSPHTPREVPGVRHAERDGYLAALRDLADPNPPQLADLPGPLADRFVGRSHKHLLKVYARGNIWDMEQLARFVREVEGIDPQATGHPVQTYYASRHMQSSFLWAGAYALGAVLVLLLLDFRHLGHSLLAMLPLAIGVVQMCGLLGWLGLPFNPANMIALPLILGIGVDHGVHLVHEWRRTPGPFRLNDSTAVALLLIATTTTASFGALVLARHQGLQSLGQVLTIGVTTCLGSSVLFFPALLAWLSRNRPVNVAGTLRVPRVEVDRFTLDEGTQNVPAPFPIIHAEDEPDEFGGIELIEGDEDDILVPLPVAAAVFESPSSGPQERRGHSLPRRRAR